ncbi:MAG: LemA family protein [Mycobacteriales bacterium]|nr:LemA family protein [Frankia sp.]
MTSRPFPDSSPARGFPRWLIPTGIVLLIVLLAYGGLKGSYNTLVRKDQAVDTQFANVEVQLQRRYDLVPNLVSAVRAALKQEQTVFGEIAEARTRYAGATSTEGRVKASNDLEGALARLLVIVEQYPQLRSNDTIRDLMVQLEGTENRIAQERRDYNATVNDYNLAVRTFPRNLIAGMFGFHRRTPFAATAGAGTAPRVDLGTEPSATPTR